MLPDGASVGAVPFCCGLLCVDCVADVACRSASCYARMHCCREAVVHQGRSVVGKGRPSAQCSVVPYFAERAVLQHEADVQTTSECEQPHCLAWLHDVEGTLRCGDGPGPVSGRFGEVPRAFILPLTRPAWSGPGTNLLQVSTVRCEAVGLPGAALLGQRMWERQLGGRLPAGSGVAAG